MKTSISFLKSNDTLEETINKISNTDCDFIHVDIMDNTFIPYETISLETAIKVLSNTNKKLDVHLMVNDPTKYIEGFKTLNVNNITIHEEIDNKKYYIDMIKNNNIKVGIALNPETKVMDIEDLNDIDYVLIMGVTPGLGGQIFKTEVLSKIQELILLREKNGYHYEISLDGGVNGETRKLMDGLDIIVSGSYVCMSDDYQKMINTLK